jgi:hypothetical protein
MMRRFQKCVRTHGMRSNANANAVARRAEDDHSQVSPRLTEPALGIICSRPCVAHLNARRAFERKPISSMSINRPLGHLVERVFLWATFRECFAIVGHTLPNLFVNTYSKIYFMHSFIFIPLYYIMGG